MCYRKFSRCGLSPSWHISFQNANFQKLMERKPDEWNNISQAGQVRQAEFWENCLLSVKGHKLNLSPVFAVRCQMVYCQFEWLTMWQTMLVEMKVDTSRTVLQCFKHMICSVEYSVLSRGWFFIIYNVLSTVRLFSTNPCSRAIFMLKLEMTGTYIMNAGPGGCFSGSVSFVVSPVDLCFTSQQYLSNCLSNSVQNITPVILKPTEQLLITNILRANMLDIELWNCSHCNASNKIFWHARNPTGHQGAGSLIVLVINWVPGPCLHCTAKVKRIWTKFSLNLTLVRHDQISVCPT